jgi:hypothetical protein
MCTRPADVIARGKACVWAEEDMPDNCGGHLLCRNCFEQYDDSGWVVPDAPA